MRFGRPVFVVAGVVALFGAALFAVGRIEFSAVATACGLLLSAGGLYLSRHPVAVIPRTQQREYAVERLAESVHVQWEDEAKSRGLADPDPMPVRWTLTDHDVSDHPHHIFHGQPGFEGSSDRIDDLTERFLALQRRRLVILGGPGSGKTTLAVQLLLQLLQVREPVDPVPVLLTANSWNTTAHPRMQDWLTLRLYEDYPALRAIHKDVPRALVDNGMVLPVIDGLDELDPAYRSAILKGLNESLGAADPLVLTCRTDEYADAVNDTDVLTAAAVIEARPLTARDAASYLDNCLPPRQRADWKPILEELRSTDDTPLAEICATPLGLWLLRTVHVENKTDPTPLVDPAHYPNADAIRAHLFDGLIPAIITKRLNKSEGTDPLRPRRIWEPDATRQRLAYLAVQLHDNRDLRWWHLPTAVTFIVTITLTWLTFGLVAMVASGLTYVLMLALEGVRTIGTDELAYDYPDVRITETFMLGAVPMLWAIALVGALIVGARIRRVSGSGYINLRLRGRGRRLAREAAYGLVGGSMVGMTVVMFPLAAALIGWSRGEPVEDLGFNLMLALRIGLTIGAPIGTAVGLARWARSPGIVDRSRTPISTYRDSRNLTAVLVVTIGLVGWFAVGLLGVYVGSWRGWEDMVQMMLAYGLLGLVVGSMVGLMIEPAWIGFVVRSRWLTIRGKLPWQVMGFLDDAHRLGLLRTAGAVYQFRHAELQDHLARSATDTTPPRRS